MQGRLRNNIILIFLFSRICRPDDLANCENKVPVSRVTVILGKYCLHVLSKGTALHKAVSC